MFYTNIRQSTILLEHGFNPDTADLAHRGMAGIDIIPKGMKYSDYEKHIHELETKNERNEGLFQTCVPCWSLSALFDLLPPVSEELRLVCFQFSKRTNSSFKPYEIRYYRFLKDCYTGLYKMIPISNISNNPIDACLVLLIKDYEYLMKPL